MLNSFPVTLLISTLLGVLSGLGIGGGSLLILWLTLALGMEPAAARSLNLLFFVPSAAISCIFRYYQGSVKIKHTLPAIIAGCIAAAIFSYLSSIMETALLKKLFGVLLIGTGLRELFQQHK